MWLSVAFVTVESQFTEVLDKAVREAVAGILSVMLDMVKRIVGEPRHRLLSTVDPNGYKSFDYAIDCPKGLAMRLQETSTSTMESVVGAELSKLGVSGAVSIDRMEVSEATFELKETGEIVVSDEQALVVIGHTTTTTTATAVTEATTATTTATMNVSAIIEALSSAASFSHVAFCACTCYSQDPKNRPPNEPSPLPDPTRY